MRFNKATKSYPEVVLTTSGPLGLARLWTLWG